MVPGVEPLDRPPSRPPRTATAPLTSTPRNIRRLSSVDGFCGSAIATVTLLSFLFCETGTTL